MHKRPLMSITDRNTHGRVCEREREREEQRLRILTRSDIQKQNKLGVRSALGNVHNLSPFIIPTRMPLSLENLYEQKNQGFGVGRFKMPRISFGFTSTGFICPIPGPSESVIFRSGTRLFRSGMPLSLACVEPTPRRGESTAGVDAVGVGSVIPGLKRSLEVA